MVTRAIKDRRIAGEEMIAESIVRMMGRPLMILTQLIIGAIS